MRKPFHINDFDVAEDKPLFSREEKAAMKEPWQREEAQVLILKDYLAKRGVILE